jgi:hypothetical protein
MPRPSRFDLIRPVATGTSSAMIPVARLSKPALSIFDHAVTLHKHLRPCDTVLLTAYARTAAQFLAAKPDDREHEKLGRLLIALGRSLRINAMQRKPKRQPQQGGLGVTWQQLQGPQDDGDDEEDED